jgi:hypothetical protein
MSSPDDRSNSERRDGMKRNLLFAMMIIASLTIISGGSPASAQPRSTSGDEEALRKLIEEWAMCTVQGNAQDLEKIMADNFDGKTEGKSFKKRELLDALTSGRMKVGGWTVTDVKVSIKGNSASATGRSQLTDATYMGKNFSGNWVWTDRFVKQRDGTWRAVSSQSRRVKE